MLQHMSLVSVSVCMIMDLNWLVTLIIRLILPHLIIICPSSYSVVFQYPVEDGIIFYDDDFLTKRIKASSLMGSAHSNTDGRIARTSS